VRGKAVGATPDHGAIPLTGCSPFDEGALLRKRGLVAFALAACDDAVAGRAPRIGTNPALLLV